MGRVITFCSGKGGTGKTSLTGGCGAALALLGRRVLCIDGDIGLRNLDLTLGMADTVLIDFTDVMAGRCSLTRALVPHPQNERLFLLTAPLRVPSEPLSEDLFRALLQEARDLFDYILIDAPAGLSTASLSLCGADEAVVVTTADATSMRDAQRIVSTLLASRPTVRMALNRVSPKLLRKLGMTVDDVMDFVGLPLLGLVPEDANVILSAGSGRALLFSADPHRGAPLALRNIARRLDGQYVPLMKLR